MKMCETGHNNMAFSTVEQNCMGISRGIPEIQWFCSKRLKTAYFKHSENFAAIKIFGIIFLYKSMWKCVKLVTTTWLSLLLSEKLHRNTLTHTWDSVILLKTAYFQHSEHFASIEIFWKTFISRSLSKCVKLVTTPRLSPLLSKKLHGNALRHTWDTVILLKTA